MSYRRSSPRAVRAARKRIQAELLARVGEWALRVAPDEPIFALALLYSFEDAALPPALGLATERERLALLASAHDADERIWNPAEWEILESEPAELLTDGLDAAWQHLAQEWEQASDDREPRALLVKATKTLVESGLPGLPHAPRAIYAVDDELVDLDRNLKATVPRASRR